MMRWFVLLSAGWLAACTSLPPPPLSDAGLLHDDAFTAPATPVDASQVFALNDAMRRLLENTPSRTQQHTDPRRQLLDVLYGQRKLVLDYDASRTRNASEAFDARSGNCLSLVIMPAAFATAAGLPLAYRQVLVDETWSRSNGMYFASGHVNLALGWPVSAARFDRAQATEMIVDFLPPDETRGQRSRPITEATVLAMYMNNRAAEALVGGALDDAYSWAREALRQDRNFLAAYNTLGVVYSHRGEPRWAQQVFQAVLAREPDNTTALVNLAAALQADGRGDEAPPLLARLAAIEAFPPFHFLEAGLKAMAAQQWRQARELFRKEAARQAANPEVHFWLAQASFRLGDRRDAERHLELARQNSTTPAEFALYGAKLGWLRALATR